ncbi:MAG: hypothetical protein JXR96_17525 [Deltaproteobacteria bacterium]|nr:hypothetical protein [Deltaproteobacteria bacterium]
MKRELSGKSQIETKRSWRTNTAAVLLLAVVLTQGVAGCLHFIETISYKSHNFSANKDYKRLVDVGGDEFADEMTKGIRQANDAWVQKAHRSAFLFLPWLVALLGLVIASAVLHLRNKGIEIARFLTLSGSLLSLLTPFLFVRVVHGVSSYAFYFGAFIGLTAVLLPKSAQTR